MIKIGDVFNGRYEILKEIGHGGMSTVYLAMDKNINKQWAIKEIRRSGRSRNDEVYVNSLLTEANMIKRLEHNALPRIVDIVDSGDTFCVIMDYIEGESLDKTINEFGAQPEELVIEWSLQICDALSYLHSQKPPIIYRDMKPGNVMLKPDGNIKIIDFGIAREYKQDMADTSVLGTRGFAPPEQYNGRTDPRSDIYALGMTMHNLLTGVDPRSKDYQYHPVRWYNPAISDGVEAIIEKCVQDAAENRYQTCEEMMYDLQHPEMVTKGYKRRQKRRLALFIGCAAMSVVMLLACLGCRAEARSINDNNYDILVKAVNAPDKYQQAIELIPYDTRAYVRLIESYEDSGFGKAESDVFTGLYFPGDEGFADCDPADVAELNYRAGTLYFNYYSGENGAINARVNKAVNYFRVNHEQYSDAVYDHAKLSECYYRICCFYKDFIISGASVDEASKEDFDELIGTVKSTVTLVENENAYNQLALYNTVCMLLNDQVSSMSSVGVSKSDALELLDLVYSLALETNPQKAAASSLKSEICDNYEAFRSRIENWEMINPEGGDD